jgi:hypothetical protein
MSNSTHSNSTILSESFNGASGSTPPKGWETDTLEGDPKFDVWRFDNPGDRTLNPPFDDPIAIFDSDFVSEEGGLKMSLSRHPRLMFPTSQKFISLSTDILREALAVKPLSKCLTGSNGRKLLR